MKLVTTVLITEDLPEEAKEFFAINENLQKWERHVKAEIQAIVDKGIIVRAEAEVVD